MPQNKRPQTHKEKSSTRDCRGKVVREHDEKLFAASYASALV